MVHQTNAGEDDIVEGLFLIPLLENEHKIRSGYLSATRKRLTTKEPPTSEQYPL